MITVQLFYLQKNPINLKEGNVNIQEQGNSYRQINKVKISYNPYDYNPFSNYKSQWMDKLYPDKK